MQQECDMHPHVFKEKLFHLSCNKKSILSLLEFSNLFLLQVFDNKGYNAWFVYFQGQILHYQWHNKNSNTKIIVHVVTNFFFEYATFKGLFSFFLFFHSLHSYLFLFSHLHFFSSIIASFIHISIVSLFLVTTISFAKDYSIQNFTRIFIELRQQQYLQAISINRQFQMFSQIKKKKKKN